MGGSAEQLRNISAAQIKAQIDAAANIKTTNVEVPSCRDCRYAKATLEAVQKQRDEAREQVDAMAAQIVELQRRVDEVGPQGVSKMVVAQGRIAALVKIDNVLRHNVERAEARSAQLFEVLRQKKIAIPDEPKYYIDMDAIEALPAGKENAP